jgi:hypothetical protein
MHSTVYNLFRELTRCDISVDVQVINELSKSDMLEYAIFLDKAIITTMAANPDVYLGELAGKILN